MDGVVSGGLAAFPQVSYSRGEKMDLKQALSGLAKSPEIGSDKPKKKVVNLPKKSAKPDKAKAAPKEKY